MSNVAVNPDVSQRRAKVLSVLVGGAILAFPLAGIVVAFFLAIWFAIQIVVNAKIGRAVADLCLLILCALAYLAGQALWLADLGTYLTASLTVAISCAALSLMLWRTSAYVP